MLNRARQRGAINLILVVIVVLAIVLLGGLAYWAYNTNSPSGGSQSGTGGESSQKASVSITEVVDKVVNMLPDGDGYIVGYTSGVIGKRWQDTSAVPEEWKDVVEAAKKLEDKFEKMGAFGLSVKIEALKAWAQKHKDEERPSEDALRDFDGIYLAAAAVVKEGVKLDDIIGILNDEILPAASKVALEQPENELKNLELTMKKSGAGYVMHVSVETKDGESVTMDVPVYYQQDGELLLITFPKPASEMPGGLSNDSVFKEHWTDVKGNDFGALAVLKSIPEVSEFSGPVVAKVTGRASDNDVDVKILLNKGFAIGGKALDALKGMPISGGADGVLGLDLGVAKPIWESVKGGLADKLGPDDEALANKIISFLSDKVLGIYFAYGDKPRLYVGVRNLTVAQLKEFVGQFDPQSAGMLDFVLANPKNINGVKVYDLTPLITSQGVPMIPGEGVSLMEYNGSVYLGLGVIEDDARQLASGSSALYDKLSSFVSDAKPEVVWYCNVPADFKDQLKATVEAVAGTMPQQLEEQIDQMVVVPYEEMGFVDLKADNETYIHIHHRFITR